LTPLHFQTAVIRAVG